MSLFDNFHDFDFCSRARREERSSRPDIIDVEFQEVKSTNEVPGFDKKNRRKQIIDEAFSQAKDLMAKDPITGMVHTVTWIEGAKWADDHRLSTYTTRSAWLSDGKEALHNHMRDVDPEALQDPVFESVLSVSFFLGAEWAERNPANV